VQFVTFRLVDSVPDDQIEKWKTELHWHEGLDADSPQSIALRKKIEVFEDTGQGECHLRKPEIAQIVQDSLLHFDGQRYRVMEWCIMPNHVHVLVETGGMVAESFYSLSSILHSWKSYSAKQANQVLQKSGPFWMPDYFDRFMRHVEHLQSIREYIHKNPVKARLVSRPEQWLWSSAGKERAGSPRSGQVPGCGR
jgi:REP element-mobilizing transposase RayT